MTFIALVPAIYTNVKQYGAFGDGKTVTDAAITTGTPTLTSATAAFTAADVGKQITVNGAGAAAANLNTTILAYVNATTVTLAVNAGTTVTAATCFYATDDTTAIAAALSAANSAGKGTVFFPAGTYLSGAQTIYTNVCVQGAGRDVSFIKLKSAANADLFSASTSLINLSASFGSGSNLGVFNWSFKDITLDGNRANQTAGPSWCIRVYGASYVVANVCLKNGYTGCWQSDWNGSNPDTASFLSEGQITNLECYNSGGIGFEIGGPHDTQITGLYSGFHNVHCVHICPNVGGLQVHNCHVWSAQNGGAITGGGIPLLVEGNGFHFTNVIAEGTSGAFPQVVLLGNYGTWQGGRIFSDATLLGSGMQIGQVASGVPYQGMIYQSAGVTTTVATYGYNIATAIDNCVGSHGALWLANDNGNTISIDAYQTAGSYIIGTPAGATNLWLNGHGLTPDGTIAKGGTAQFASKSWSGFLLTDNVGANYLVGNTKDGVLTIPNGVTLAGNDAGFVVTWRLYNGTLGLGQSATAAALAAAGTITTTGVGTARVAPTVDVTGVILQLGTFPGQLCIVSNESAFTITFAVSGTSHVAAGTTCKIAPNSACLFYYNSVTSLWTPTAFTVLPVQSATAVAIATAGTIVTTDLDVSRLAPTANVTGIIMAAGVYAGQVIRVLNESAFTLTMAAAGTSHVANGVLVQIPPLEMLEFVWDSATSLWYTDFPSLPVQSATAVAIAASGAIPTAGLDVSRLAPTAARSGITMQAGTYAGQKCFVMNESAFVLTYNATPATSLIANSAVVTTLPVTSGRLFEWNSITGLWY